MMHIDPEKIDIVILCGGLGLRLKKIVKDIPKPMVKVGDNSFLNIIIDNMVNFGFRRFILCTGYKGEIIRRYYRNNKKKGVDILFSHETELLGTGGAVKKAKRLIKSNPFFVMNGDTFSEFSAFNLLKFHKRKEALISMVLTKSSSSRDYGEIKLDKSLKIICFIEKNKSAEKKLVNAGVYIFSKKVFDYMPRKRKFSLERDFFPRMIDNKFYGYIIKGTFIDIGTPERYEKAKNIFRYVIFNIG